jgi:large subunit ribosomal protein L21
MSYAIITLGGKQYVVREGQKLTVDRLATEPGKTFSPEILFVGGDGKAELQPSGVTVTARVLDNLRGEKVRIGKYRKRTGYKRHTGFRAALTTIQIESIAQGSITQGSARKAAAKAEKPAAEKKPDAKPDVKPDDAPKGLPAGYADMTVAEINEGAKTWNRPMLEAALEYEQAHAKRKGAIGALEHALAAKEEG